MKEEKPFVCPVEAAGMLDGRVRRWLTNPTRTLAPFIRKDMTVLDMGCGPGLYTLEAVRLLNGSGKVIAADLQQGMLDIVKKKIEGTSIEHLVELYKCEPDHIGFIGQVDLAYCIYMIHEVPDQDALFAELATIVKPGGKLLIVEPKFHVTKKKFLAMFERLTANGWRIESTKASFSDRMIVAVH